MIKSDNMTKETNCIIFPFISQNLFVVFQQICNTLEYGLHVWLRWPWIIDPPPPGMSTNDLYFSSPSGRNTTGIFRGSRSRLKGQDSRSFVTIETNVFHSAVCHLAYNYHVIHVEGTCEKKFWFVLALIMLILCFKFKFI